jgi:hypothetical protein
MANLFDAQFSQVEILEKNEGFAINVMSKKCRTVPIKAKRFQLRNNLGWRPIGKVDLRHDGVNQAVKFLKCVSSNDQSEEFETISGRRVPIEQREKSGLGLPDRAHSLFDRSEEYLPVSYIVLYSCPLHPSCQPAVEISQILYMRADIPFGTPPRFL